MSTGLVLGQTAQGVENAKWNNSQFGQQAEFSALRTDSVSTLEAGNLNDRLAIGPSLRDPALLLCDSFPDLIFAQSIGDFTTARTSDAGTSYAVADNFIGVLGPINSLHFWGLSINFSGPVDCVETHRFDVTVYGSAGTQPDYNDVICTYTNILPNAQLDTGEGFGAGDYTIWRWDFDTLSPSCGPLSPSTEYWLEIVSVSLPTNCMFLWLDTDIGDGKAYQQGAPDPILTTDQGFCLDGETVAAGSCCDDSTGECVDDVVVTDCLGTYLRWTPDTDCVALVPACGEATGACCYDNGTCDDTLTYAECVGSKTTGPLWLGPGTTCDECCTVLCPAGGIPEGEPFDCPSAVCIGDCNCDGWVDLKDINPFALGLASPETQCEPGNFDINGDGLTDLRDINPFVALLATGGIPFPCAKRADRDDFNGGCNSDPPIFSPISCGQTICGESGTFFVEDPNDPGWFFPTRDMDWYELTVTDPAQFTMTVEAEFPVRGWIVKSDNGACDGTTVVTNAAQPCTTLTLETLCLEAETYWFIVAPNQFTGVPCGADYVFTLECDTPCDICVVECPTEGTYEAEDCGEDLNGGCNFDPDDPALEEIACGDTICGSIYAEGGTRDTDWFSFTTVADLNNIEITYEAEFPSFIGLLTDGSGTFVNPTCDFGFINGFNLDPCEQATYTNDGQPAGEYWFLPLIDDGDPIYDGYPCGTFNAYVFTLECIALECDDLIFCIPGTVPIEEDPDCGPGTVDNYNGGCDTTGTFAALDLDCDDFYCCQTGAWGTGKDYDWYRVTLTEPTRMNVVMSAETNMAINIVDISGGCPGVVIEERHRIPACTIGESALIRCLDAGEYYIRVYPVQDDNVDCTVNYDITLECEPCVYPCDITCIGDDEVEQCGEDLNGGCNSDPEVFDTIACGQQICGTIWADDGARDTDWYQLQVDETSYLQMTQEAEMPAAVFLGPGADCPISFTTVAWAADCEAFTWQYIDFDTQEQIPVNPGETITFVFLPAGPGGAPMFDDYPCGDLNDYRFLVECSSTPW